MCANNLISCLAPNPWEICTVVAGHEMTLRMKFSTQRAFKTLLPVNRLIRLTLSQAAWEQMPREWLEHRLEEFHHIAPEMRGNHIHQCIPRCFKSLDYLLPKSSFIVNRCGSILYQKMHKSLGKFYISFHPIPLKHTFGIHAFDDCGTGKRSHLFLLCLLEVCSPRAPSWPLFLKGQPP